MLTNEINAKEITIELSSFCPLNCIHCSTWYTPHYYDLDEYVFDTDNVIDIAIRHIRSTPNIPIRIRFSGGEPLPFLSRKIFENVKKECPNIVEWIITTSGSIHLVALEDFVHSMQGFEDKIIYRISLYGNEKQHTKITRSLVSYNNSIKTVEWLLHNGQVVELTTPIFNFWNTFNVMVIARKYEVPIRMARLIDTPTVKSTSQRRQLLIAKIMKILYNQVYLTCSLYGQCKRMCDYPKSTILATGKMMGCAIDKLGKDAIYS